MQTVRIYNSIPEEEEAAYAQAIVQEYRAFFGRSH